MKCQTFNSVVEPGFWSVFAQKKLDDIKLNDCAVPVSGWYSTARSMNIPPQLRVTSDGFVAAASQPMAFPAEGQLYNTNTVEDFKQFDKKALVKKVGEAIAEDIKSGKDPVVRFVILSYADLKRHKFLYWFCFPSFVDSNWEQVSISKEINPTLVSLVFNQANDRGAMYGIVGTRVIVSLSQLAESDEENKTLVMVDPGTQDDHGGWPLFNLLYWVRLRMPSVRSIRVLCVRRNVESSMILTLKYNPVKESSGSWVGWESNAKGKMGPRLVDLSSQLDPKKLANSACNLNLKLMRWRAFEELNTDMLSEVSCLLVGSGTLGCAVSRSLLGWGIRNITMLDNGLVSYSNPVRQSLFEFEDCLNGGKPKAFAAAAALNRILPGMKVEGVQLNIPMPGHFVTSEKEVEDAKSATNKLEQLIRDHDVIILLTDTRESRWLPTMLGAKYDKLVLNSALGFDSFMVMRHGCGVAHDSETRLGCYFCNDVVAPQNSMKDRTLDQQCTVTRPGLAPIAGSLVVELLVALLHSKGGNQSPMDETAGKLGELPHQIRGSLPTFNLMCVSGQAFSQCTACSKCVIDKYETEGFQMLLEAFNKPDYLENLTGLTKLKEAAMAFDEEDFDFDGSGEDDF